MQKRNVWVQCLSWWLTFCLNALVSWAVSNTAVHFAISLELIALPSLILPWCPCCKLPREAGPCEKLPGSVPMHQDRCTPHPDTSAVGKLSCIQRQAWNLPKVPKTTETTGYFIWVWPTFAGMWVSTEGGKERWGEGKCVRGRRVELSHHIPAQRISHHIRHIPAQRGCSILRKCPKIYIHRPPSRCGLWEQFTQTWAHPSPWNRMSKFDLKLRKINFLSKWSAWSSPIARGVYTS